MIQLTHRDSILTKWSRTVIPFNNSYFLSTWALCCINYTNVLMYPLSVSLLEDNYKSKTFRRTCSISVILIKTRISVVSLTCVLINQWPCQRSVPALCFTDWSSLPLTANWLIICLFQHLLVDKSHVYHQQDKQFILDLLLICCTGNGCLTVYTQWSILINVWRGDIPGTSSVVPSFIILNWCFINFDLLASFTLLTISDMKSYLNLYTFS